MHVVKYTLLFIFNLRSLLYGAVMDRPKAGGGKEGGKKGAVHVSRAKITRTNVDPQTPENLYRKYATLYFFMYKTMYTARFRFHFTSTHPESFRPAT